MKVIYDHQVSPTHRKLEGLLQTEEKDKHSQEATGKSLMLNQWLFKEGWRKQTPQNQQYTGISTHMSAIGEYQWFQLPQSQTQQTLRKTGPSIFAASKKQALPVEVEMWEWKNACSQSFHTNGKEQTFHLRLQIKTNQKLQRRSHHTPEGTIHWKDIIALNMHSTSLLHLTSQNKCY